MSGARSCPVGAARLREKHAAELAAMEAAAKPDSDGVAVIALLTCGHSFRSRSSYDRSVMKEGRTCFCLACPREPSGAVPARNIVEVQATVAARETPR